MLTIKDIARECHVSVMTVSRALNDSKGISPQTRERILRYCNENGYVPNFAARSLILKKTNMIGLLVPDIASQYYAAVIKGVSSFLDRIGYGLIVCNSDRNKSNEVKYLDFLSQKRVDGIILIATKPRREEYLPLLKRKIPLVLIDNYIEGLEVSFVENDNYSGGKQVISHMVNQGYRRIGVILGDAQSTASNERLKGYLDVLQEHHLPVNSQIIVHSNATFNAGFQLTPLLLKQKVDAIFAVNDTVAMGVMKYCYVNGIRIPTELGLAGYDDIEQSFMLPIPLTTVHQRKYTLGQKAAEILMNEILMPDVPKQTVKLQPQLVVRKSCNEAG
ncbi:MAG TPA: LacI family DNA-binding transcriptional regulator [Bacillota bacterium]